MTTRTKTAQNGPEPEPDAAAAEPDAGLLEGAEPGAVVVIAGHTAPGEPANVRYGFVLGRDSEVDGNPNVPNGQVVLVLPPGCEARTFYVDDPAVSLVAG